MTTPVVLITGALKVLAGPPLLPSLRQAPRLIAKGDFKNGYANDQRRYCYEFTSC